jgi:hypothetical protein
MPQQTYRVTDPQTGKTIRLTGDSPPTEAELTEIFSKLQGGTPAAQTPAQQAAQAPARSWLDTGADLATGAAKSVAGTVAGLGEMVHRLPGVSSAVDALYGTPGLSQAAFSDARKATTPTNTPQAIGKGVADVAQFMVPVAGTAGRAAKVADVGRAAGLTMAQTGDPTAALTAGALTGGINAAIPAVKKGAGVLGERIERALVKATKRDIEDGFTAANVFKHKVGGTLEQTYVKANDRIKDLSGQLQRALTSMGVNGQKQQVDVLDALNKAATAAGANPARTVGQNTAMGKAVESLLNELEPVLAKAKALNSGRVDLLTANELKQGLGQLGAWKHDPTGRVVSEADKAMETLANSFYDVLKKEIEAKSFGPVKAINKQIGELLAIKHAVARRIPVEQRANVLNLGDLIGFGTGAWGVSLANRVLKSGQTANVLSNVAQSATSPVPGRLVGAAVSGGSQ